MKTTANSMRDWMKIFRSNLPPNYEIPALCECINYCTNPRALRTDEEHMVCTRMAAWCLRKLAGRRGWEEDVNGRLVYSFDRVDFRSL